MKGIGKGAATAFVVAMAIIPIITMFGAYYLGYYGVSDDVAFVTILVVGFGQFLSWAWMLVKISGRWTARRMAAIKVIENEEEDQRCR